MSTATYVAEIDLSGTDEPEYPGVEVYLYAPRDRSNSPMSEITEIVQEVFSRGTRSPETVAKITNRIAAARGLPDRVYPFEHRGYAQSDWGYGVVAISEPGDFPDPAAAAAGVGTEWSNWARGDIYSVQEIDENGEVVSEVSGYITDDPEEAIRWHCGQY